MKLRRLQYAKAAAQLQPDEPMSPEMETTICHKLCDDGQNKFSSEFADAMDTGISQQTSPAMVLPQATR